MVTDSLIQKLSQWAHDTPNYPALHYNVEGQWHTVTWQQYYTTVTQVAGALVSMGLEKGECVVIIGNNRVEWLYAQFGIMAAGGVATPSYQTNTADQLAYIVNHSRARYIFAENQEQYDKLLAKRAELTSLEGVILFDQVEDMDESWAIHFPDFLKLTSPQHEATVADRIKHAQPDDTSLVIYTSGTTGVPKGVLISHKNNSTVLNALVERFPFDFKSRIICYLPLSHIAEQATTNVLQMKTGGEVFMCDDVLKMKDYLPYVRPNVMLGVPRVWEKFETALTGIMGQATGFKKKLLHWALATELAAFDEELETGKPVSSISRKLANKLVIQKIKEKMGMDQVVYAFTGAAPCGKATLRFFASLGIRICEVYGMTETTAILSTTAPDNLVFGTVGKPISAVELKIADDGEILARGDGLSKGYLHNPEATEELWQGGWLHTGDVGEFDENGNLRITDRKKDLIITAGAKNVAPQPIEAHLKRIDGISQAVVVGDKRPYLVALLTIDSMGIENVAQRLGIEYTGMEALSGDQAYVSFVQQQVELINGKLARYETIKRFRILPEDFSVEAGDLTPSMKVKRKVVNERYNDLIEEIYDA